MVKNYIKQFVPNLVKQKIRENLEDPYINHSNGYKTIHSYS